jgi:large subunit ribosomal protein L5
MIPRLKATYEKEIVSKLMSKLNFKNKHEVPKIEKIILNMGLGEDALDGKKLKSCVEDMGLIAGQKPIITKFKKSISNFKTRKGSNAGVKVTLRSYKMYEFIDRLINIALPRIKDFSSSKAASFVLLVVTIVISRPLILSTLSKLISGNIICSLIPKE